MDFITKYKNHKNIAALIDYKKTFGNTLVPTHYGPDKSLGSWVAKMRSQNKHNKLKPEYVKILDEIGFCWESMKSDTKNK